MSHASWVCLACPITGGGEGGGQCDWSALIGKSIRSNIFIKTGGISIHLTMMSSSFKGCLGESKLLDYS